MLQTLWDSNCDWTLEAAGVGSWKKFLILRVHRTMELKARRNGLLTPPFMSSSNILLPSPSISLTSLLSLSVPHGLSGAEVQFQTMKGVGDMVHDLADVSTIPAPFAPPSALMGGNFTHLSALILTTPFCLTSLEGTAHCLRTQLLSLSSINATLLHLKGSSFSLNYFRCTGRFFF